MKFFRFVLIFLIFPLILFFFILFKLSPSSCFFLTNINPESVATPIDKSISEKLNSQYKNIQDFAPLIQFGNDWFRYNVSIKNNVKVAFVIDDLNFYSEATTTMFFNTQNSSSTVLYGETKQIAQGIRAEQIPNLIITQNLFAISPIKDISQPEPVLLKIQSNKNWQICIFVKPQVNYYFLFIYLECWVVCMSFFILLKEARLFINKGFR